MEARGLSLQGWSLRLLDRKDQALKSHFRVSRCFPLQEVVLVFLFNGGRRCFLNTRYMSQFSGFGECVSEFLLSQW
jgi:hypothetical protein